MKKSYTKATTSGTFYFLDKKCTILHRTDGPAIEFVNGDKEWFYHGRHHRVDGPAIKCKNGYKVWYLNGMVHRVDGPAKKWKASGVKEWYICDIKLTKDEHARRTKLSYANVGMSTARANLHMVGAH